MTFWILILGTMALSLLAAARVKAAYQRHSRTGVRSGVTGAETAQLILQNPGIRDVEITHHEEMLGDQYDPMRKRLVLASPNYFVTSLLYFLWHLMPFLMGRDRD